MSRILLLSDIHANLAALDAVLKDAGERARFDSVWSMGDAVGYASQPNECIERLRDLNAIAVLGNHELAALGKLGTNEFNSYAAAAAEWTARVLTEESKKYLVSLPLKREQDLFTILHGSPRDPVWEYITDASDAASTIENLETPHCINGHTHVPAVFSIIGETRQNFWPVEGQSVEVGEGRTFINPGSVGQPRDSDPRAAYALLDDGTLEVSFFRVEYPVQTTQSLMEEAGLPDLLIERLAYGR